MDKSLTFQKDPFELLAILLVSHGSSGAHLLFKYPFVDPLKAALNPSTSLIIH